MIEKWASVNVLGAVEGYEVSNFGNVRKFTSDGFVTPKFWDVNTSYGMDRCVVLETKSGNFATIPVTYLVSCCHVDGFKENFNFTPIVNPSSVQVNTSNDSESSKQKKGVIQPKKVVDMNTGVEFASMKMCQHLTGLSKTQVQNMTRGKVDEVNGYRIRFV